MPTRAMRRLLQPAAACVLSLLAGVAVAGAQPADARGQIAGRVLDRERGGPVATAQVRVTAQDTRAFALDTTGADGRYSVPLPPGNGPYAVRAERIGDAPLTVFIPRADIQGGTAWRDLRLTTRAIALSPVSAVQTRPDRQRPPPTTPGSREETTLSWTDPGMPIDPGDLAALAALQPGVQAGGDGLSFHAQDPSQARTTLDGATYGSTSLPKEALGTAAVLSSTYDVSRGQFSSGLIAATTLSGTNLFGSAVRSRISPSPLQWSMLPGASGSGASLVSIDAGAGGALVPSRLFWYGALSGVARGGEIPSLEHSGPVLLRHLGVQPDSVAAFTRVASDLGLAASRAGGGQPARSRSGSALLRLDYDFADRHSLMLRLNGGDSRIAGLGNDPLATSGTGGSLRETSRGVLAQLASHWAGADNTVRVYATSESRRLSPELPGPSGIVSFGIELGNVAVLRFGGSPLASAAKRSLVELSDELTVALLRSHELKAGIVYTRERATSSSQINANGTFTFRSLDDLRAGLPASYTRTLGRAEGAGGSGTAAFYLGDTWSAGALSVTFGTRVERRSYPRPARADSLPGPFGGTGGIPPAWALSPRLGWSYSTSAFSLRGGIGRFIGSIPAQSLGEAAVLEGSEVVCVGPAAPTPEWRAYAADQAALPTECSERAPGFVSRAPSATVYGRDLAAPRTWQASFAADTRRFEPFLLRAEGALTIGRRLPLARDLNATSISRLQLGEESDRPVYVPSSAVDARTGAVAPAASRLLPEWAIVREIDGRGRSTTEQLTHGFFYPYRRAGVSPRLSAYGSYTFTRARDLAGTLPVAGGALPLGVDPAQVTRGPADRELPHDFLVRVTYRPDRRLRVGLLARLASGAPFTPRVDGDVNGDGAFNDPAFVFDPAATSDAALLNRDMGRGRSPEELRIAISQAVPNPAAQVLAGDSAWGLGLTREQRGRLMEDAEALGERVAPLGDTLASIVSSIETGQRRGSRAAWAEATGLEERIRATLLEQLRGIEGILSAQQWSRLPEALRMLPRHFVPDRGLRRR